MNYIINWPLEFNFIISRKMLRLFIILICSCLIASGVIIMFHVQYLDNEFSYIVIIDAGSSGSRVYLYKYPADQLPSENTIEVTPITDQNGIPLVLKAKNGLSSFYKEPYKSIDSIRPLLAFAENHIPKYKHSSTPLYILATAGMRLLPLHHQNAILNSLREKIKEEFNFYLKDNSIEIINGKQEGLYQWLAVNYGLGKFRLSDSTERLNKTRTVGIIDMGGASVQIAFEIPPNTSHKDFQFVEINLSKQNKDDQNYQVYIDTFLGFGANEKLEHYFLYLIDRYLSNNLLPSNSSLVIYDPCHPKGLQQNITFDKKLKKLNFFSHVSNPHLFITFIGTGHWEECERTVYQVLHFQDPSISCAKSECSLSFETIALLNFKNIPFYGFSEVWYSLHDVFDLGGNYEYRKVRTTSQKFCETDWSQLSASYEAKLFPRADPERFRYQCFKAAWLQSFLHYGLQFPFNYNSLIATPNTMKGSVVHWTLGAAILKLNEFLKNDEKNDQIIHTKIPKSVVNFVCLDIVSRVVFLVCITIVCLMAILYLCRIFKTLSFKRCHVNNYNSLSANHDELKYVVLQKHSAVHKSKSVPTFW